MAGNAQGGGYNVFSALNMMKQDKEVRKALIQGESHHQFTEASYQQVLEWVRDKISQSDEYRRVLSDIEESSDNQKANDQLMMIIYTLLQKYSTPLNHTTIESFQLRIFNDMTSYGILTEYLDDPTVEEINVFGPGEQQIEIVQKGRAPYKLDEGFPDAQAVIDITKKMVRKGNMVIDQKSPRVDSYMGGGTRISAMIAPIIREDKGAVISIRKQTNARISIEDYMKHKSAMEEEFELLRLCVRNGVSGATVGATGSGKTTLLNFLVSDYCDYAKEQARVYIIEESREMQLPEDSKTIYTAVVGEPATVTSQDLLKSALRFHPTFICAAEMRGAEAMDAMMAAQTGHIVWSTFHADSGEAAFQRLLMMCKLSGTDLSEELLMRNLVDAFPIIVATKQLKDRSRRITGIFEATGTDGKNVVGHYIYKMQVSRYHYAEDGVHVKKIDGFHQRVGDLSDTLAQRIFDNCGNLELVQKFARKGWEPEKPHTVEVGETNRAYEEF